MLPYLTADLEGTGGALRAVEEDFRVEEVPAYLPLGSGEHVYAWVEKRGLTTAEAVRVLAKQAALRDRDIGYAGLKDKRAITRQWFSLPLRDAAPLRGFQVEGLSVLELSRHGNKLRPGHLRGNRFVVGIRGAHEGAAFRARAILDRLAAVGVANAFGPQRFGRDGQTAALGRALLLGGTHPDRARAERDRFLRKLALSAFQSSLFNRVLEQRLRDGTWNQALLGDVLQKPTGAAFVCEALEVDAPRVAAFEVSPAGPMFGAKLLAARGAPREYELGALREAEIEEAVFEKGGDLTQGARRAFRVRIEEPQVEQVDDVLRVAFTLPRGSYATVVMREIMKGDVELPDSAADAD